MSIRTSTHRSSSYSRPLKNENRSWCTIPTDPINPFKFVEHFELNTSNAMWPQLGAPIHSAFVNTIETSYNGHVEGLDYANPAQAVGHHQHMGCRPDGGGESNDLVSGLSAQTVMVLTNTIYFNSLWDIPFDPRFTGERFFSSRSGGRDSGTQDGDTGRVRNWTGRRLSSPRHANGEREYLDGGFCSRPVSMARDI